MQRFQSIQALRGIAALMVVYAHAIWSARDITGSEGAIGSQALEFLGRTGVDVFFVISGFIIARTMQRYTAAEFLARRWWRVAPMFYLASLPFIGMALYYNDFQPERLWSTILLWPAWNTMQAPFLTLGWTLCFEMLFYTGAALVLLTGRPLLLFGGFVTCGVLATGTGWPLFQFLGNPMLLEFGFGLLIAQTADQLPRRWLGATLIPLGLAVLALDTTLLANFGLITDWYPTLTGQFGWARVVVIGIPAALIVYGALQFDDVLGRWALPVVALGDASYSLYLSHPSTQFAIRPLLVGASPEAIILAVLGVAVAIAFAVHRWIEQPLQRMPRRLGIWQRFTPAPKLA